MERAVGPGLPVASDLAGWPGPPRLVSLAAASSSMIRVKGRGTVGLRPMAVPACLSAAVTQRPQAVMNGFMNLPPCAADKDSDCEARHTH